MSARSVPYRVLLALGINCAAAAGLPKKVLSVLALRFSGSSRCDGKSEDHSSSIVELSTRSYVRFEGNYDSNESSSSSSSSIHHNLLVPAESACRA